MGTGGMSANDRMRSVMRFSATAALIGLLALPAYSAEPQRQLGVHEHGHGFLNVAIDGASVSIEFQGPGSEVVVSTAAPGSDERKRDAAAAVTTLEQPARLFRFPAAAGCAVTSAKAHFTVIGDEPKGAAHASDAGKTHSSGKAGNHDKGHGHGKAEGHGDGGSHKGHRDYHGAYAFTCTAPAKLSEIGLVYFETFPKAGKLTVQLIGPKGQTQIEATRAAATVDLSRVK